MPRTRRFIKRFIKIRTRSPHSKKETILKKAEGLLEEPLDKSLQEGLITENQHYIARHYAYLHKVRFGKVKPTLIDYSFVRGEEIDRSDPEHVAQCGLQYKEMSKELDYIGCRMAILNLCVYKRIPSFLQGIRDVKGRILWDKIEQREQELRKVQDGLDALLRYFS